MSETRVIGAQARKIGGGGGAAPAAAGAAAAPAPARRGRPWIIVVVALLAVLAGAVAAYIVLGLDDQAAATVEPEPEPGVTVGVEPRNINLADGHYLRLGFAIELSTEAEEIATAQAVDIAIELFSGRGVEEVNDAELREGLRVELTDRLVEAYGEEVLAVYLTDFVTQ